MPLLSESKMTSTKRMASTGLNGVVVEIGELESDILISYFVRFSVLFGVFSITVG